MRWPWQKTKNEQRSITSGFTAEIIAARESYISGRRGIGELTASVQTCVSLWECGLSIAAVRGTRFLTAFDLSLMGRSLALRGEAVFFIASDRLIPCADWDLKTRDGEPVAYRLSISEAGGAVSRTALAAEVLHVRIGADVAAPWAGQAPLRRASITAGMLHAIEDALRDIYENAPIGSQIVPFPESPDTDKEFLSRGFKGKHGRVLLRESVNVSAAGGATPQVDWKPSDLSPDLSRSMTTESLKASREAIYSCFGVLPSFVNASATGPVVREGQRHLAQWTLAPIAKLISEEASLKLGGDIRLDVMQPLQAYDAGGRARAFQSIIRGLSEARKNGIEDSEIANALKLVDWASE